MVHARIDSVPSDGARPRLQVTLLEPLGIAIHAANLAVARPGEDAAVLGAGPIGLLLVQLLRLAGVSRIHVVDPV